MPDFHVTFRDLLHAVNLRHGTGGFTPPPKEGVLRIFSPWKIQRLRSGLNPRTWVPKASTLPLDHRSRLQFTLLLFRYWSLRLFSSHVNSSFRTETLQAHFCNTSSPCTPLLSNDSSNKAHKFVGYNYNYCSNSATRFSILSHLLNNHCISHLSHSCCSVFYPVLVGLIAVIFSVLVNPHRHCQEVVYSRQCNIN